MIKGNVDLISRTEISGWAKSIEHPEQKCLIVVKVSGKKFTETKAEIYRPDLKTPTLGDGYSAFALKFSSPISLAAIEKVEVFALIKNDEVVEEVKLPFGKNARKENNKPGGYQSFDDQDGDSKSSEKLKRLRLPSLEGKKVLDIGCNEGFFCNYAVKNKATRVLGIDTNANIIASAKKRTPEAEFINTTWWNLPDEKFDIIIFTSAIHYERNQKELLSFLKKHLNPNGVLVLECGVVQGSSNHWTLVQRHDGPLRFPNANYLIDVLLDGYAVTAMGRSVDQSGDPVPRFVFHCSPMRPTFLFIYGPSKAGKTTLSRGLSKNQLPIYSIDHLFHRLIGGVNTPKSKVSEFVKTNGDVLKLDRLSPQLIQAGLAQELVKLVMDELPFESGISIVEGEMLIHVDFRNELIKAIESKNGIIWNITRSNYH